MTESAPPLAWLDELFNSAATNLSQLHSDLESELSANALATDSLHPQDIGHFIDGSFALQLGKLASSIPEPNAAPLAKRARSRPKQRFTKSKMRRFSGVRTDTARRMEIEELKLEVPKLEERANFLIQKAISRSGRLPALDKARLVNDRLREILWHQRLWIARGISAISQSRPQCSIPLLNHFIHLPRDAPSRVKTLCNVRADILRDGREILHERMRYLNSGLRPQYEISSHTTADGEACTSVFSTIQVESAASVKDVVDCLRQLLTLDQELFCKDTGTYTIAGPVDVHPDLDQRGISHRRCALLAANGKVSEFKGALFSEYQASSRIDRGRSDQATIVIHSIENDQLHPHTSGCMRLDMTTIISIHHHQKLSQKYGIGSSHTRDSDDTIVIARASFAKLCPCDVPMSTSELHEEMNRTMSKVSAALDIASHKSP